MVQGGARTGKGRMSRFGVSAGRLGSLPEEPVTKHTRFRHGGASARQRRAEGLQPWMNCIWVPASSMTSPLRSGTASPETALPFTVGRVAPST